jgi:hypothetical protein
VLPGNGLEDAEADDERDGEREDDDVERELL